MALQAAAAEMLDEDGGFSLPSSDPLTYREAMASEHADNWQCGIKLEASTLHDRLKAWELADIDKVPAGTQLLGCKPVFRTKRNKNGVPYQWEARFVAKGYAQRAGVDFKETFAPVAKFSSICLLIALAARHGYVLEQADIDSAYPQADKSQRRQGHLHACARWTQPLTQVQGQGAAPTQGALWSQAVWTALEREDSQLPHSSWL